MPEPNAPTVPPEASGDARRSSAPFRAFADTLAAIAEESGRNAKADILGATLQTLPDADLAPAARWAAGRVFPLADQRTVNVGHAALLTAISQASGADKDALRQRLVALGDPGDVAEEALGASEASGESSEASGDPLTIAATAAFFADLAATRGSKKKTAKVAEILGRVSPPEARFLVKLLTGETRIGLLQGGVEAALARTFGREPAAVRRAHMLTGDLGQTALRARHGTLGEARFALFQPITFMLATPAEAAPGEDPAPEVARLMPETFAVEDKYDGIRAQAHVAPEAAADPDASGETLHGEVAEGPAGPTRVALFSRTLDENTGQFPDLVGPLAALAAAAPEGVVLDGEIVPVWPSAAELRVAPFAHLQKRLGRKAPPGAVLAEYPVAFVAYDVLYAGGALRLDEGLEARQRLLDALPLAPPLYRSAVTVVDDPGALDAMFDAARARGNEGLMVKRLDSAYRPGRRGQEWLKVKRALATLDVVVTSVEVGSGGRRKYLSDFTFAVRKSGDDPTLVNVGKAYSGLTDAELAELTDWFKAHTRQQFAHGRVRVVDPEVVLEVAFDAVQESKRHKSGYALRFPRIVRRRRDKPASEVDSVDAVRAIYESQLARHGPAPSAPEATGDSPPSP